MAIPAEAQGITAAILCAVFSTANLMISKILQAWDWPYFFLAGLSAPCITLGLAITMACQKTYKLQRREVKWVILRGFFGCGNNVLSVCAVLAGAEAIFLTNILSSVASKKCPAALSSTMMNGSCMAFGYVMDILIFHKVPTKLTVIGAAMMLSAVMTMALTRLPRKSTRTENQLSTKEDTATPSSVASATSLASFVASEFAERQEMIPSELPEPSVSGPRQRLPSTLPATLFGAQA